MLGRKGPSAVIVKVWSADQAVGDVVDRACHDWDASDYGRENKGGRGCRSSYGVLGCWAGGTTLDAGGYNHVCTIKGSDKAVFGNDVNGIRSAKWQMCLDLTRPVHSDWV